MHMFMIQSQIFETDKAKIYKSNPKTVTFERKNVAPDRWGLEPTTFSVLG